MENNSINDYEKVFGKLIDKYESLSEDASIEELTSLTNQITQTTEDFNKHSMDITPESIMIKLEYKNISNTEDLSYAYKTDSGFDLRSSEDTMVKPKEVELVSTGVSLNIPKGFEVQIRSRSGLSLKEGLFVLNSPGTIDQGYIGEIKIILANFSNEERTIKKGDRIAQACLCPVVTGEYIDLIKINNNIKETERGSDGFGSTGK